MACLEDVAEVFIQRSAELDGLLARRWEYLWENINGRSDGPDSWTARLRSSVSNGTLALNGLFDDFTSAMQARILSFMASALANPPTAADTATHIDELVSLGVMKRLPTNVVIARRVHAVLLIATSCIAVTACGGGNASEAEGRADEASGRSRALGVNQSPTSPAGANAAAETAAPSPVAPPVTPPPQAPMVGRELLAQILQLEKQGVLPNLDRGTDIAGPDSNGNGIRDDIDAYIAVLPITELQKKAVAQRARAQQAKLLLDPTDKQAVKAASVRSMAAAFCIGDRFDDSDVFSKRIEAITANTPERAGRFLRYLATLDGTSVRAPDGDTCEP